MEGEKLKYEVHHGGGHLYLDEGQIQSIFLSYKEQFAPQQVEGGTGPTDEQILGYLHYVLDQPETVVLLSNDGQVMGMGGIRYFKENAAYPNNAIVELGTLSVPHAFRGKGISEDILRILKEEALWRKPRNSGVIFSLITANPAVEHQAEKAGYKKMPEVDWIRMTSSPPEKKDYLEKWGYKPYVNMEHVYNDPGTVNRLMTEVKYRVQILLGKLLR